MKVRTKFINQDRIPFVVEPIKENISLSEFLEMLQCDNAYFKEKLLEHGVLLFRNFPLSADEHFHQVVTALNTGKPMDYIGGDSPRTKQLNKIYTSTEAPPEITLHLHNEMSFAKNYPKHIYFYCDIAPVERGETIIGDAKKIYEDINDGVKEQFSNRQLKYISRYYCRSKIYEFLNSIKKGHKSWIEVFETENKDEMVKRAKEGGFEYKWLKNDWIEVSQTRPAFLDHPITKDRCWFNQVHLYDFNPRLLGWKNFIGTKLVYANKNTRLHDVAYGDGSKIERRDIYHAIDVLEKNTVKFPWRKGDVMVCDNIRIMHGRAPFTGKRRILTAMTQ